MLRNNYNIIYVYNVHFIFPVQILLTNKSIIRHKFTRQINWHFSTATYIFRHTLPYYIYWQTSSAIFTANFLPPGRCFLKTIKCILYILLLIENYSQMIISKICQYSTQLDKIRFVYCIHQDYSPQNVSSCMNLSKYVEVCRSL